MRTRLPISCFLKFKNQISKFHLVAFSVPCYNMNRISNVTISNNCDKSLYLKPKRMFYEQDGRAKTWDIMKVHDSVSIVIFNISRQVLIFVRQFRPAVYYARAKVEADLDAATIDVEKYSPSLGITTELCAGIVDKDQSLVETAKDEILEECGYDVPLAKIEKVTSFRSGVGVSGSLQTFYYAEVTDNMRVSKGGGNYDEGEYIDVIEMTPEEAQMMIYDESLPRPASMLFALVWFFSKKNPSHLMQKL